MIEKVAEVILKSRHLIALTGAGISAESGIPTFRGPKGLWKRYRPEDLATPEAFARNPKLVWEWYAWRINLVLNAKPNPAHYALAELEKMNLLKMLITQNVDDLHERAGSKKIVHLHGEILKVVCTRCEYEARLNAPPKEIPPKCPVCQALLRPGVVWFGEPIPPAALSLAFSEAEMADVILVVGTSGVVMPAGQIPYIVKSHGDIVIEINIQESAITPIADFFIKGRAGEILPRIVDEIKRKIGCF